MYELFEKAVVVSEQAALACAPLRGLGDCHGADRAAVEAMRKALNRLDIDGRIVIGEGERDKAPMLYIGEEVGLKGGLQVDIAVDPLEGTNLCAHYKSNSLAVVAFAKRGNFLHAPDVYMQKIAIGPDYPEGIIDIEAALKDNICALADFNKCQPNEIRVCVLDRPRHKELICDLRKLGCVIRLIEDGDIAAVINTIWPAKSGIDVYIGTGGAPEGVLAAAALVCQGGQMQAKLVSQNDEQIKRAEKMGIKDFDRKLNLADLASGDIIFCATGVTDSELVKGVQINQNTAKTDSLVMFSKLKILRKISSVFSLDGYGKL